jgi:2-polyprenyl-3-methyl-5-hydroxy-6-metoxy-1,4-benzoquinol methylase
VTGGRALVETHCVLCGASESEPSASGWDFEYQTLPGEFRFVRCKACEHQYLNPRPGRSDLPVIYPASYYAYSEGGNPLVASLRRRWEAAKIRLYRDRIGDGPRRVLDVGCGNGRLLELMRDFAATEWQIEGIDIDSDAARQTEAKGFRVHVGRMEDFAPGDESFDGVVMLQLIEHVEDPARVCERVFAMLRPGGCFVIETPNLGGLDHRIFRGRHWGHYHFPRHWNLFSTEALHRMLTERGFDIEHTDYLISTSAWILSLHNYFLDRGWPDGWVRFFHFQNPLLLSVFVVLDALRARLGYETSNQRVVARKPTPPGASGTPVG